MVLEMRFLWNSFIFLIVVSHPIFSPLTRPIADYIVQTGKQTLSAVVQHEVKRQWGELWH